MVRVIRGYPLRRRCATHCVDAAYDSHRGKDGGVYAEFSGTIDSVEQTITTFKTLMTHSKGDPNGIPGGDRTRDLHVSGRARLHVATTVDWILLLVDAVFSGYLMISPDTSDCNESICLFPGISKALP